MKCKIHGTELIEVTALNEALCHVTHLIVRSWFCPECQSYPKAIREKLANPNTDCKTCDRKNPLCFAGWGESLAPDGETEATSSWGGAGPDCPSGQLAAAYPHPRLINLFSGRLRNNMRTKICFLIELLGFVGFLIAYRYTGIPLFLFVSGVGFAFGIAFCLELYYEKSTN